MPPRKSATSDGKHMKLKDLPDFTPAPWLARARELKLAEPSEDEDEDFPTAPGAGPAPLPPRRGKMAMAWGMLVNGILASKFFFFLIQGAFILWAFECMGLVLESDRKPSTEITVLLEWVTPGFVGIGIFCAWAGSWLSHLVAFMHLGLPAQAALDLGTSAWHLLCAPLQIYVGYCHAISQHTYPFLALPGFVAILRGGLALLHSGVLGNRAKKT